jgi:hypothetical protein
VDSKGNETHRMRHSNFRNGILRLSSSISKYVMNVSLLLALSRVTQPNCNKCEAKKYYDEPASIPWMQFQYDQLYTERPLLNARHRDAQVHIKTRLNRSEASTYTEGLPVYQSTSPGASDK